MLMRPKHQARYSYTLDEVARYHMRLTSLSTLVTDLPTLKAVPLDPKDVTGRSGPGDQAAFAVGCC